MLPATYSRKREKEILLFIPQNIEVLAKRHQDADMQNTNERESEPYPDER